MLGYKQLAAIERVFKDLKHLVDIRPVYHRLADRIRAHVILCWLAMLLIQVAENETEQTWHEMKDSFDLAGWNPQNPFRRGLANQAGRCGAAKAL